MRSHRLSELLASVEGGVSVNSEDRVVRDGEIGVLKTSAVSYGTFAPNEHKAVLPEERVRATRVVRGGTILFSRMNTPGLVAASAYVERDHPSLYLPDRLWEIVPREGVDAKWLSHALASAPVRAELSARASGTSGSMKNISKEKLLSLPLMVPPLDEQRRIAAVLSAIDTSVAAGTKVASGLRALRTRLLDDLLTQVADTSRQCALGDVAVIQTGVAKNKASEGAPHERPYLSVANVKDGHLDLATVKTIRVADHAVERFALRDGDVLFCEGGDADKVGRGTVWRDEIPGCLHQNHVFAVRTDLTRLLPEFLSYYRAGTMGRRYFLGAAKQTTNLASINSSQLRAMPVPLPPVEVQQRVVRILAAIERSMAAEASVLDATRRVKDAVACNLMATP